MNNTLRKLKSKFVWIRRRIFEILEVCEAEQDNWDFETINQDLIASQPVETYSSSYRGREYNEYMSHGVEVIPYETGTGRDFSDVAALAGLHMPARLTRDSFDAILKAAGDPESVDFQREVLKSVFMDLEIALRCIRTKSILLFEANVQQLNGSSKTIHLRSEIRSSRYSGPCVTIFTQD